eukprot:CAMPEP_0204523548 /NCGR_PEP_ID=MMETSP0661-20131031/6896_1 /ASSEMBLY_ACC=CAM_ASM_000606 /TAXON_ID=109239 /ORGANISM="Alexandrium margalefi, Strain AMGDE01CS-322" /LENGTH=137 /DNA_ID=CAMNT_0051529247 /DNA_START=84 /DNA_END=497 /DNA_ORIENTATION=+
MASPLAAGLLLGLAATMADSTACSNTDYVGVPVSGRACCAMFAGSVGTPEAACSTSGFCYRPSVQPTGVSTTKFDCLTFQKTQTECSAVAGATWAAMCLTPPQPTTQPSTAASAQKQSRAWLAPSAAAAVAVLALAQ